MPDFLVSAATGALSPVLRKLGALLSDEYKRYKGLHGEVESLRKDLEAMHAFLLDKSEEENPNEQDKAWMKEVRELSYDIEDSLDDFKVRVDDDSPAKPDGFIAKCKKLLQLDKTKARRRIAKEIEKLKGHVKVVSERHANYKQDTKRSKVMVDPRALAIFEDASRLVGIDQPKQEIISFLTKDDGGISSQQPKMVSIVGIGGIGKTTLAKQVYEELKNKHKFPCSAFLSVSRRPDMFKILRTILSQVNADQPYYMTKAGSIQQLIMEINKILWGKRHIIVVDDVWDVETWDTIKYALSSNSCGSVILTTTRIHNVAKACCSLYPNGWVYQPKPLEEHDSKRLFQNRIFGPQNECPGYLKEVSDKILKKCGGLPLAIITISGLLATKAHNGVHSVTKWDQVQTSIGRGLDSIGRGLEIDLTVEGMMRILSHSYFDLPHHLKACLLYLSIFPEDYEIDKKHLVLLWVAEGFVPAESTCTLYESGEKSFIELINRNLILPGKMNERTSEVNSCRVHDTVLDFIVWKSTEDNLVTVVHGIPRLTPPLGMKVRRLNLQGKSRRDVTLHKNQNYANVRSIISFGLPCSLLGVRFLRVLDFSYCGRLRNHHLINIGELLQLRYLGLRRTSITELPEQIGALQYLETLDIGHCNIIQLPTAIVRLKRLVNLQIGPTRLVDCFPSGIKNMQALEELAIHTKAAATFVEEIGDLTKMRHLDITLYCTTSGIIDEESYVDLLKKMVSSFQRLNKLQTLFIQFNTHDDADPGVMFNSDYAILEVPWCSASLRKIISWMNPMSRVPSWMKSLVNLEEIHMRIKKLDQESLCILGDLPVLVDITLEIVIIKSVDGVPSTDKQRVLIINRYGYRNLRHFSAFLGSEYSRPRIPMLTFEAGSMPKLEHIDIEFDADITISVSNGPLDFGLKHLSQLTEVKCSLFGTELNILLVETAIQKDLDNHPKLPSFVTDHYPSAEALPLPTDLSFTIHHHSASPELGGRHGQRRHRSKASRGTTIRERELFQGAPGISDRTKGTSGAAPATSDVLGPRLSSGSPPNTEAEQQATDCYKPSQHDNLANAFSSAFNGLSLRDGHPGSGARAVEATSSNTGASPTSDVLGPPVSAGPQQQEAFMLPYFTFGSGSPPNTEAEQQAMDCYKPSQHDDLANAFSSAFNSLSLRDDHPGSSATAVEVSSLDTGSDDKMSSPTTDDNTGQSLTAALSLPTDLSITIHHHSASPDLGRRHGQQRRRSKARQGATTRGRELVQGAPLIPDRVKGTSGAAPATSDVSGPPLIAAPQQQEAFVPPCFTFGSGSPPNAEVEQQEMDCYEPSQHGGLANAFSSAFNGLSLRNDQPGSSATAVEAASSDTDPPPDLQIDLNEPVSVLEIDLNDPVVEEDDEEGALEKWNTAVEVYLNHLFWEPNEEGGERLDADQPELPDLNLNVSGGDEAEDLLDLNVSGAAAATYDVLGPRHVSAPQKQGAFVPPCFTFSSGSPPKAEAEQEAMDCYEPSQHDNLAIAFSSAFNGLSLRDDHPSSSATAIEASSSYTGSSSCQEGGDRQEQQ